MSLLGLIGTVAGGLLGRPKTTSSGQNFESHINGLMRAAKRHGWNPLTLLQNGQAIGPSTEDRSALGASVSNAFALAGDALLSKRATAAKLNDYQRQNERLQSRLGAITLRSPVPGVYGQARLPADPEVYGDVDVSDTPSAGVASSGGPARYPVDRPLVGTDIGFGADPRRPVDNQDVKSHAGYILVDNPKLGIKVRVPTLDGDEPLHWYDYPSLSLPAMGVAADMMSTFDPSMNGNFDGTDPERWKRRKPKKRPYERMGRDGALPLRTSEQRWAF